MADDDTNGRRADDMSLAELRAEIAAIDRELVELIAQRTYVAETVAAVKAKEDVPTTVEEQEARVLGRARDNAERFDLDPEIVADVFGLLIELNKDHQQSSREQ